MYVSISGTKTTKARSWSIPIVNHTWLEDCFVQWRNLTVALEKYIVFPAGVDFSKVLGERGLAREVEDLVEDEEEQEQLENEGAEEPLEERPERGPTGTENSARDATEVEAEMGLGLADEDGDVMMNGDDGGSDDDVQGDTEEAVARHRQKSASKLTLSKPKSRFSLKPKSKPSKDRSISPESAPVQRFKSVNKPSTPKTPVARAETSSEDEDVSPVKRPVRRLVKRTDPNNDSDFGDDVDVREEDVGPRRSARKSQGERDPEIRRSPRKAGEEKQLKRKQSVSDLALEKGRKKAKGVWIVSEDEEADGDLVVTKRAKGKGKAKEVSDATDGEDEDESEAEAKESQKKKDRKRKANADSHSEPTQSEKEEALPASKSKAKNSNSVKPTSKPAKSTPKRILSVLMPPLTLTPKPIAPTKSNVAPSSIDTTESASKSSRKKIGPPRKESIKAATAEASGSGKSLRGRAEPGSASKGKAKQDTSPVTPAQVEGTRLLSKRAASTKATQVLKDQAVDMNHFQLEMKHAKARKSAGGGDRSIDFVFDPNSLSTKKKRMSDTEDVDEEDERDRKKRKTVVNGTSADRKGHESKTKKKAVTDTEEESDGPVIVVKSVPKKSAKRVSLEPYVAFLCG